jgi:hypothetical protein
LCAGCQIANDRLRRLPGVIPAVETPAIVHRLDVLFVNYWGIWLLEKVGLATKVNAKRV